MRTNDLDTDRSSSRVRAADAAYDLWSRLMKDRIVFIGDQVHPTMANIIVAQFLFLEKEDPDKDIEVYINSPGGDVMAGLVDLRHDEAYQARHRHYMRRHGRLDGRGPAVRRHQGQAGRTPQLAHHDPPGQRGLLRGRPPTSRFRYAS